MEIVIKGLDTPLIEKTVRDLTPGEIFYGEFHDDAGQVVKDGVFKCIRLLESPYMACLNGPNIIFLLDPDLSARAGQYWSSQDLVIHNYRKVTKLTVQVEGEVVETHG